MYFWAGLIILVLLMLRALSRASSRVSSRVGVEIARDLGRGLRCVSVLKQRIFIRCLFVCLYLSFNIKVNYFSVM